MIVKCCQTCKHNGQDAVLFPCSVCRDNDLGEPTYWEAPLTEILTEEINHPTRYKHGDYECVDVMVDVFGKEATQYFWLLSAFKYIWRKDFKGGVQDIKKARWSLDKWLELEGNDE